MAKAEGIPPTASVASAGPGLRYIGEHCYAYSGTQTTDGSNWSADTVLLDFTSGTGFLKVKFNMAHDMITGNNLFMKILLNEVTVVNFKSDGNPPHQPELINYRLLIPPFTHVEYKFGAQAVTCTATGWLIGRVYDV